MRKIFYLIFISCLAACQQDHVLETIQKEGFLSFSEIVLQSSSSQVIASRAVEKGLNVSIYNAQGEFVQSYVGGSEVPNKIPLEKGTYTCKVYSDSYEKGNTWTSEDKGEPIFFFQSDPFEIKEDEITSLSVKVPMTNVGVTLHLPEGFADLFKEYTFTVTPEDDRTITLQDGEVAYLKASASFTYSLSATNIDGDSFTQDSQQSVTPVAGTIYTVCYEVESGSLQLVE